MPSNGVLMGRSWPPVAPTERSRTLKRIKPLHLPESSSYVGRRRHYQMERPSEQSLLPNQRFQRTCFRRAAETRR